MKTPLLLFLILQLLDLMTTVTVIALGGEEKNPLIAHLMTVGPIKGLILSKLLVSALAVGGALLGRLRGIGVANVAFGGVVAWNVSVIARLII